MNPLSWSSSSTLTLNAANNIYLNANITAVNGGLTLTAGSASALITSGSEGNASATGVTANLILANFNLTQGNWTQVNPTLLPTLDVTNNFQLNSGGGASSNVTFIRAIGGSGSSNYPYLIADVYGLEGIGSNSTTEGYYYDLANSINAAGTSTWNSGAGFIPISNFTETFNGEYFTINGVYESTGNAGLFSNISGATIEDLGVTNVNLTGSTAGGISANSSNSTLDYVYVTGNVKSTSNYGFAGGLVGSGTSTTVNDSYNNANVIQTGFSYAGGLFGNLNTGTINNSYSSIGTISSSSRGELLD